MGLTLFVSKFLIQKWPFYHLELSIRFRPGQAYVSGMGGISMKIWRHHKPEVTTSKFQLRRIPSSWVPLDWLTTSQLEHSWKVQPYSHFCRFWYPNWVIWLTHPAQKKYPFTQILDALGYPIKYRVLPSLGQNSRLIICL